MLPFLLNSFAPLVLAAAQTTTLVSVNSDGVPALHGAMDATLSASGRFVAFHSTSNDLVAGDTNGMADVFVHDRLTGRTERISVGVGGVQGERHSLAPDLSADGRIVAFFTEASTLFPGDANGAEDVLIHDRLTGRNELISVSTGGVQGAGLSWFPTISSDGRYVAFESQSANLWPNDFIGTDVFVRDRLRGVTECISLDPTGGPASSSSYSPAISGDGQAVAFSSWANNLIANDTNLNQEVFVFDRGLRRIERISHGRGGANADGGSEDPRISHDGRFVTFISAATNLVAGDLNQRKDVFVHDRTTGSTTRVSVSSAGQEADADCAFADVSADGRFVTFQSSATTLAPGDVPATFDVFLHDRLLGTTARVSVDSNGFPADDSCYQPRISADGRSIAFHGSARNLSPTSGGILNEFVHDRLGIHLTISGTCPGLVTLQVTNGTPLAAVALFHGPAGVTLQAGPRCHGKMLGIQSPVLGRILTADAAGSFTATVHAPAGACGRALQAVDLTTCQPSNAIRL